MNVRLCSFLIILEHLPRENRKYSFALPGNQRSPPFFFLKIWTETMKVKYTILVNFTELHLTFEFCERMWFWKLEREHLLRPTSKCQVWTYKWFCYLKHQPAFAWNSWASLTWRRCLKGRSPPFSKSNQLLPLSPELVSNLSMLQLRTLLWATFHIIVTTTLVEET